MRSSQFAVGIARFALAMLVLLATACPAQDDPFAAGVRTTPWLSPADEKKSLSASAGLRDQPRRRRARYSEAAEYGLR